MNNATLGAVAEAAREELARQCLIDFAQRLLPDFKPTRHLQHLAGLLESVERGETHRLLVTLFPGSGKSTLLQCFSSWYLGRNPRRKILAASAGAELAERNSRESRALFTSSDWPFDVELSKDTTAMNRWSTKQGGSLAAFGVGTVVTGWRANLFVLDDLQNDALSVTEREQLWSWYREVLMPRLEPGGAIVLIQQRWGEDDLPGRIVAAPDGGDWEVVRLPAIAEENDALGRGFGESLWPERWPIAELERKRISMGSRAFQCAFQGNPVPAEGNLIKAEWLQRYDVAPASFTKICVALDAASKTGVRNDYSALVKLGVTETGYFLLDVWRDKVEFPALLRCIKHLEVEHPAPSVIYIEDTSNAVALIQQLRQETTLPIVPISAKGSKESRVEGITGILEAKRVFLPNEAPWLLDFERELLSFPLARHDDMVDAFTLALSQMTLREEEFFYFSEVGPGVSSSDTHVAWSRGDSAETLRQWKSAEDISRESEVEAIREARRLAAGFKT